MIISFRLLPGSDRLLSIDGFFRASVLLTEEHSLIGGLADELSAHYGLTTAPLVAATERIMRRK